MGSNHGVEPWGPTMGSNHGVQPPSLTTESSHGIEPKSQTKESSKGNRGLTRLLAHSPYVGAGAPTPHGRAVRHVGRTGHSLERLKIGRYWMLFGGRFRAGNTMSRGAFLLPLACSTKSPR